MRLSNCRRLKSASRMRAVIKALMAEAVPIDAADPASNVTALLAARPADILSRSADA